VSALWSRQTPIGSSTYLDRKREISCTALLDLGVAVTVAVAVCSCSCRCSRQTGWLIAATYFTQRSTEGVE
jgi:hypothetical protein